MAKQAGAAVREFSVRRQFGDGAVVCSIIDWRMAPVDGLMTVAELLTVRDGEIVSGELIYDLRALLGTMSGGLVDLVERGYENTVGSLAALRAPGTLERTFPFMGGTELPGVALANVCLWSWPYTAGTSPAALKPTSK